MLVHKRSAIPVFNNHTPSASHINSQKIIPELNSKYSQSKTVSRNLFDSKPSTANTSLIDDVQHHVAKIMQPETSQLSRQSLPSQTTISQQQTKDLHNQVCHIANKCTCEKQFLVDKIGEGKYKIGNTKNVVFIRVSS